MSSYYLEKDTNGIIKLIIPEGVNTPADGTTYTISSSDVTNNGFSESDEDITYTIVDNKDSITTSNASTVVTTLVTDMDALFKNETTFNQVWEDIWLKEYAVALVKRQWGSNLMKFEGMQLPGGVQINGRQIYEDAINEIAQLRERIRLEYELPADFFVG